MDVSMNERQMPLITMETFQSLIEPILASLTENQWVRIQSKEPDYSTMILFAVLVLDLNSDISRRFAKNMTRPVTEEHVEHAVGNKLLDSFARVLGGDEKVLCSSYCLLKHMIGKEVVKTLNLSHPNGFPHSAPVIPSTTLPHDLHTMAGAVAEMLSTFVAKRTFMCDPPRRPITLEDMMRETCVQAVIRQEVSHLTERLMDNVPDYEIIKLDTARDIKNATEGINTPLSMPVDIQRVNIKKCFMKRLAKASVHRTLEQLRKEFPKDTNVQSKVATGTFIARLGSLLDHGLDEKFRTNLSDLMYRHLTSNASLEEASACVSHPHLYADIWSRVTSIQALMRWWVTKQAKYHICWMWASVHAAKVDEMKRASIWSIVTHFLMILARTTEGFADLTNVRCTYYQQYESIVQHLVYIAWAELKDADIRVPEVPSQYYMLTEELFKALRKTWGSPFEMFVGVTLNSEKFNCMFVSALKKKTTKGAFSRFVNPVVKTLSQ
ncbi:hypothetical protein JOB18_043515 [Solea senegalensis]|uniref:Uncharacterized protein n=1 Tax=Solea senegalensis TaxID=28829 RepID=A0AAV6RE92_SOLSE|nr:hypothetical protein JOB18_043515 [Solea senegalensis]